MTIFDLIRIFFSKSVKITTMNEVEFEVTKWSGLEFCLLMKKIWRSLCIQLNMHDGDDEVESFYKHQARMM